MHRITEKICKERWQHWCTKISGVKVLPTLLISTITSNMSFIQLSLMLSGYPASSIILYLFIYSFHCFTKEPHAPHHWSPFRHPGRGGFGLQARDFGGGHVTHSTGGRCLVQEEARKPITTTIDIRGLGLGEWKNISCQNAYKCSFLANPYSAYNFHKSNKPLSFHRRFTRINWRPWLLSSWCSSVRIWTEPVVATTPLGWPLMRRSTLPQKDVQQLYKKDVTGFKACHKTELPLLWASCGNLLTYQLLLLLRIRDLKPTWSTWNVQSSLTNEAEAPGHDEESQNALLKAFRMDRNNGDAWEGLVDIVSVPWDISKKPGLINIWREKTKERERQKMNMMFFCFRPKVCLIQVYTDAIHGFRNSVPRCWDANSRQNAVMSMS